MLPDISQKHFRQYSLQKHRTGGGHDRTSHHGQHGSNHHSNHHSSNISLRSSEALFDIGLNPDEIVDEWKMSTDRLEQLRKVTI
jgi:hypothetical protein